MTDWAANDYEPTPEEIAETFGFIADAPDGDHEGGVAAHGGIELIPSMERYIWHVEGVYWGNRRVTDDGHIHFDWVRP